MQTVIIDAMGNESNIPGMVTDALGSRGIDFEHFKLRDLNIEPCRACGACSFKSPGKCVFDDDVHDIMRAIAKGKNVLMLTPVTFGGYSSKLKSVVDKFMLLATPKYSIKDGYLVHPCRYGRKNLIGIGAIRGTSESIDNAFNKLVEHNAHNIQGGFKTLTVDTSVEPEKIKRTVENLIEEVSRYE